jgi:hypothetical protein
MRFLCLLILGAISSLSCGALYAKTLLPPTVSCQPVVVKLEKKVLDGFLASSIYISSMDVDLYAGVSSAWQLSTSPGDQSALFKIRGRPELLGELRLYRAGSYFESPLERSIIKHVAKMENLAKQRDVSFKRDADGLIQLQAAGEERRREVFGQDGAVIFSNTRTIRPKAFGKPYFIVEYQVTNHRGKPNESVESVCEMFVNAGRVDIHISFTAPPESYEQMRGLFVQYIESFNLNRKFDDPISAEPEGGAVIGSGFGGSGERLGVSGER